MASFKWRKALEVFQYLIQQDKVYNGPRDILFDDN